MTNVKTLAALIAACHATGAIAFGTEIMQKAAQKKIEQHHEQAAEACGGLIDQFQNGLTNAVALLRLYREQEKAQTETVQKLDRAFRYFAETGNPFPAFMATDPRANDGCSSAAVNFCRQINIPMPKNDDDAWKIPADWKPTEQVEKTEQK